MNLVKREGFEFQVDGDGVARVRDVDVAKALGLKNVSDLRAGIRSMIADGEFTDVCVVRVSRATQMPTGGTRVTEHDEYWLDKAQAYTVSLTRRTDEARAFRKRVVSVYIAVEEDWKRQLAETPGPLGKFAQWLFAPKPTEWESCFVPSLVRALSDLYGFTWTVGARHPVGLRNVYRLIYDAIFSAEVGAEIKRRNPDPRKGSNHSQHLSVPAREYLIAELAIVEEIARQSTDRVDFWTRMDRRYRGGMLQMPALDSKWLAASPPPPVV